MKNRILAAFTLLLIAVETTSCKKDDLDPIAGYNSKLDINNIVVRGIAGSVGVKGILSREYILTTDSTPISNVYIDTFDVLGNGHLQTFHFNTPQNATVCNVQVKVFIEDGLTATSATIGSIRYFKDSETMIAPNNIELSGANTSLLYTPIYTVDF